MDADRGVFGGRRADLAVRLPADPSREDGIVTIALLVGLGIGRARIAKRSTLRTVAETVTIGIAAALAGIVVGLLIDHGFGG